MSCDFDIRCLDCCGPEDQTGFMDLNWGGDRLLTALKHRAELEASKIFADPEMWWFLDEAYRLGSLVRFFAKHVGHRLVVVSEYGHIYAGTCHKGDTGKGFCDLEEGHKNDCHWPPRLDWNPVLNRYVEEKS